MLVLWPYTFDLYSKPDSFNLIPNIFTYRKQLKKFAQKEQRALCI